MKHKPVPSQPAQLSTQAMIMAAGLGLRMRPKTLSTPKPFLRMHGIPLIQFSIDWLRSFGIQTAVVNVHHLPEVSRRELRVLDWGGMRWTESDETKVLLGSAGGLRQGSGHMSPGPFLTVNADVVCWFDLHALFQRHAELRTSEHVTMTLALLKNKSGGTYREMSLNSEGTKISSVGSVVPNALFYTGVAILEQEVLDDVPVDRPTDFLESILLPQVAQQRVGVFQIEDHDRTFVRWMDMGNETEWKKSEQMLKESLSKPRFPKVWKNRLAKV